MPELLSPGVYPTEVDYSQYIRNLSTSTFGIVGVFEKGPVGKATLVTSLDQAIATFGDYLDASGYYGMLALKNFFENGGQRAYVSRVVKYTAGAPTSVASNIMLVDRAGTPLSTLKVTAATPGTWGDSLSVEVANSVAYPTDGFNIKVKLSGVVVETFADLKIGTLNVTNTDYAEKRINGVSAYITVTDQLSVTVAPNNRPAVNANIALASGNNGLSSITVADWIGTSVQGNGLYAFDSVAINFVAIPGAVDATTAFGGALNIGLVTYAELRKTLVAILETPVAATVTGQTDFRNGTGSYTHAAFNSSYAALYSTWLWVTHPVTGRLVKAPPAGFVAGIYARTDAVANVWSAPAGLNRGIAQGAVDVETRYSQGDKDTLYPAGINAFVLLKGSIVMSGQKTTQLKSSALDRVNVRRLMCHIEEGVNDAALFLVDEPNTKRTWEALKRLINPFLRTIKDGEGVYEYLVICDEFLNTGAIIDTNTLKARVLVKPTKTAEFLAIEFAIAPTAADLTTL